MSQCKRRGVSMCTKYCAGLRILSSFELLAVSNFNLADYVLLIETKGFWGFKSVKKL